MKREIEFTVDFAEKKKGDTMVLDPMLASTLVNQDKVAKYKDVKEVNETSKTKLKQK
jgi:hypothetical protein